MALNTYHLSLLVQSFPGVDFTVKMVDTEKAVLQIVWTDGPTAGQVFKKMAIYWALRDFGRHQLKRLLSEEFAAHIARTVNRQGRQVVCLPRDGDNIFLGTADDVYRAQAAANGTPVSNQSQELRGARVRNGDFEVEMQVPVSVWGEWVDRIIESDMRITGLWSI